MATHPTVQLRNPTKYHLVAGQKWAQQSGTYPLVTSQAVGLGEPPAVADDDPVDVFTSTFEHEEAEFTGQRPPHTVSKQVLQHHYPQNGLEHTDSPSDYAFPDLYDSTGSSPPQLIPSSSYAAPVNIQRQRVQKEWNFPGNLSAPAQIGYNFPGYTQSPFSTSGGHMNPRALALQQHQAQSFGSPSLEEDFLMQQNLQAVMEKRRRRRESHNAVERRRRENINDRIHELGNLLPESMLEECNSINTGGGNKPNKGAILRKSVDHIKLLRNDVDTYQQRIRELEKQLGSLIASSNK